MQTHRDLEVWRDGVELVKVIYQLTRRFPDEERYGLTAQLRRAAVSVPSNIAEGAARGSRKDFARFVGMARGSVAELETQLVIAAELGFCLATETPNELVSRLYARLNKLHSRLASGD